MSEKFGLDWREYDNFRMFEFINIMKLEAEKQNQENKYGRRKTTSHNRSAR